MIKQFVRGITFILFFVFAAFGTNLSPAWSEASKELKAFEASITGAITADFSGTGSAIQYQDGGTVLTLNEGTTGRTIVLTFPPASSIGEHRLKSFGEAYKGNRKVLDYGASYSQIGSKSGAKVAGFTQISEGTISIRSLSPLDGSFVFASENSSDGKIRLRGEFRQIKLTKMP